MNLFIAGLAISSLNYLSAQQIRQNVSQGSNHSGLSQEIRNIPVQPQKGSEFCSISPYPYTTELVQPNGRSFMGKIFTINPITYLETIDGYTVMQDPSDGYFKYAAQGADGNLYLSAIIVSEINARTPSENSILAALNRHARYEGNSLLAILNRIQASEIPPSSSLQAVFPSTGIRKALLLLIQFPDLAAVYPSVNFNNYCNQVGYNVNGQTGSFRDFYLAASYGALTLNTDVGGWYTSTNNRATYGVQSLTTRQFLPAVALVRQAVDAAELSGVNYANYDGDGNGSVDVVMVIHSGRGAEESGNVADIWSHRWTLSANALQVTYDGKLVNDYIIQAEKLGPTNIANVGVLCHEFGHALGLPDLYDTDGGSEGLGDWCLMAGGSWNNSGKTPPHPSVWCKDQLGWMDPTVLTGTGTINSMSYSQNFSASYRINTPVTTEYFLIENRQNFVWDAFLPAAGLCIYHIDETRTSNQNPARYWVNLEQADGLNHLNNNTNSGDIGDPYPGSSNNTSFSCGSNPNSNTYNGSSSGIGITAINFQAGNTMGFTYGVCCPTITVTNPAITTGTAGTAFSRTFTRTGGTGTVTFSTTSTLPAGLSLSTTGVLSGTPTQIGTFPIVVKATDINLCFGNGAIYNLVIGCPIITVTNPSTTTGTLGSAFSQTFTRTGGIGAITFTTTSTLPSGFTLSAAGVLSGTPTQTGTFTIVVKATDINLCFGNGATYNLVIGCPTITVSNPAIATGTSGSAFSQTFTSSGGLAHYTFTTISTLPTGLSLSTTGLLSGTPTQTGTFMIVVRATDASLCFGDGNTYSLTINPPVCPTITVTNPAPSTGISGSAFSQTFTASGSLATYTYTTVSALPTGLALSTTGVLSGTPTQTGTFPITVTATDANLCFGNGATYNLVIGCPTITVTNPVITTGTAGSAFNQTFTRTSGIGAVTFSTTSTLPTGLALSTTGV